jgi:hypothetical protein
MRCKWTLFAALLGLSVHAKTAPERWDGVITFGTLKVPFSMQIEFGETSVAAVFTSGETPVASSSGTIADDKVRIQFDSLGTVLEALVNGGSMKGTYAKLPVELNRFCTCGFAGEAGPDISGVWTIESGGRLAVERKGDDTFAAIQLKGDERNFGTLSGRFDGLSFTLSHFTGTTAAMLEVEPRKDGKLDLELKLPGEPSRKLVASKN